MVEHVFVGRAEQGGVPPEPVDDIAGEQAAFGVGEGHPRSEEGGVDPAPVDVSDEQHGSPRMFGHAHVDNIVLLEVDFAGAARAFEHHDVMVGGEAVVGFGDGLP